MGKSNHGGERIQSLQRLSFSYAYKFTVPADTTIAPVLWLATQQIFLVHIVHVVEFIHAITASHAAERQSIAEWRQ